MSFQTPSPAPSPPNDTATAKPLAAFTRLNHVANLYKPDPALKPKSPLDPTTILLCSWTNAHPKHISYYTRTYMSLYPAAQIILVTITTKEFIFESESKRRKDVLEAVTAILAPDQATERVLLHAFSNGGGKRVYNIIAAYRALTGKTWAPKAFIFDSAPGMPQYRRDVYSISHPMRNMHWIPWMASMALVCITTAVVYVSVHWMPLGFWYDLVWGPMLGCNDPELMSTKTVMGFMYSKEDEAVDWEDVERWAEKSKGIGYRVETRLVKNAEHVQLFRGEGGEEAYWGFVKRVWGNGNEGDLELENQRSRSRTTESEGIDEVCF